jgi:hypothetical protein
MGANCFSEWLLIRTAPFFRAGRRLRAYASLCAPSPIPHHRAALRDTSPHGPPHRRTPPPSHAHHLLPPSAVPPPRVSHLVLHHRRASPRLRVTSCSSKAALRRRRSRLISSLPAAAPSPRRRRAAPSPLLRRPAPRCRRAAAARARSCPVPAKYRNARSLLTQKAARHAARARAVHRAQWTHRFEGALVNLAGSYSIQFICYTPWLLLRQHQQ